MTHGGAGRVRTWPVHLTERGEGQHRWAAGAGSGLTGPGGLRLSSVPSEGGSRPSAESARRSGLEERSGEVRESEKELEVWSMISWEEF